MFKAHDIGYFFIMAGVILPIPCLKVAQLSAALGYLIQAIHIPKTVRQRPAHHRLLSGLWLGIAKYVATSIREAGYDVASMAKTSTKVFILQVMGPSCWLDHHRLWLLASEAEGEPPHLLLVSGNSLFEPKLFHGSSGCLFTAPRLLRGGCVRLTIWMARSPPNRVMSDNPLS